MGFKFVLLWTDVALWLLFAALVGYVLHVRRSAPLRATWLKVLRDPAALCSALVLVLFLAVTALDSVHFRRALPAAPGQAAGQVFYDNRAESLLDLALARQLGDARVDLLRAAGHAGLQQAGRSRGRRRDRCASSRACCTAVRTCATRRASGRAT